MSAIYIAAVEDEMVTLHRDGKFYATLYADCPEQANDFFKARKDTRLATTEEWCVCLGRFSDTWETKYPEDI